MKGREVVVLANDVVPGMGMAVAAPGLRAWGLALGLVGHGHPTTLVVNNHVVRRAWQRDIPPLRPGSVRLMTPAQAGDIARTRGSRAFVTTNSNHVAALGNLGSTRLIYDFFAPKMLEMAESASADPTTLATVRERKIAALATSSAVVVNGAKKLPYVAEWLARAGNPELPRRVVNLALPPLAPSHRTSGPVHAVISGYIQPWSRPGIWAEAVLPMLDDGSVVLHLLVGTHWGGGREAELPEMFEVLLAHPNVVSHGTMEFGDFREFMATCDVSIDLFQRNPERELAMVTRTVVALSCGVPVIHVPFTEVSPMVAEHGAGWLVDADDIEGIRGALGEVAARGPALAAARSGAVDVATRVLAPDVATRPLHELLLELA